MEAEIWKRLPEELFHMILARLPVRVLGKMRTVCKQWNDLLSSRDALQVNVPNWSLHSSPGFLIQISWDFIDDVEYWVVEGGGSHIYKIPLLNHIVVDTCKGIFCCRSKEHPSALSIGIPGTNNWSHLPPPPPLIASHFRGMTLDYCTRRCTLLLGYSEIYPGQQQGEGDTTRIDMCIYDSETNEWTQVSMMVPGHMNPSGKGVYSNGKFYWSPMNLNIWNCIIAFNVADRLWTKIPLPHGCRWMLPKNLCEYNGQVVLMEQNLYEYVEPTVQSIINQKGIDCVRLWKLNEAEIFEIWCELSPNGLGEWFYSLFPFITVNNSGLVMVIYQKTNGKLKVSIFNSKGESIVQEMKLPGLRTSQVPVRVSASTFESNNMWWP